MSPKKDGGLVNTSKIKTVLYQVTLKPDGYTQRTKINIEQN